jgi:cytochrome c-type biogenesis protein CcmH
MKFAFYIVAAVMIATALLLIVVPLIREGRRQKQARILFATALAIVVVLPGVAAYLYDDLGTPLALNDPPARMADVPPDVDAPNSRAEQEQQDIGKWMAAAHAYDNEQRPSDARDAYQHVLDIDAKNTAAMIGWVEADMTQHADYSVAAPARLLLQQVIALEPNNQRALWLLGISQFQQENYASASATWRHLQQLLDVGSALAKPVAQQIAIADAKAKSNAVTAAVLR